jgi:hypothetical protein
MRQLKRGATRIGGSFGVLKSRHVVVYGAEAVVITFASVACWVWTDCMVDASRDRTIMLIRQHKVRQGSCATDEDYKAKLDELGITDPLMWEKLTSISLARVLRRLELDHHVMRTQYALQPIDMTAHKGAGLSAFTMSLGMKSARDKNIVNFLQQLADHIPGIIVFEAVNIKREGDILSHAEFEKLRKARNKRKVLPSFSAEVKCSITVPSQIVANFAK